MDIETIRGRAMALPIKPLETPATDDELWEGDENGAKFILTKEKMSILEGLTFF